MSSKLTGAFSARKSLSVLTPAFSARSSSLGRTGSFLARSSFLSSKAFLANAISSSSDKGVFLPFNSSSLMVISFNSPDASLKTLRMEASPTSAFLPTALLDPSAIETL